MQYANIKIFTSLNNALQDKSLNAFVVASPSATHYPLAREIIKSGKHVLVEKPLALSSKDAHKLINLAKKNRVNLMVGHVLLFHPAIIKMKELIEKNKIGRLQYIYSNRLNLGQVRSEENVFWSLAPHDISLFQFFTESYPSEIKAFGGDFLQKGIHDSTITMIEYPINIKSHIFLKLAFFFKNSKNAKVVRKKFT